MTIGQRIAERRKILGISQESLGERMGVSRQAISKWEADGAIPEIDKLIALSKLFGVSVGWLLGTEPEAADADEGPKEEAKLSDEQLKMIEQIVQKYQQVREPKRKPWPMLVCAVCAVVALILSVIGLSRAYSQSAAPEYKPGKLPEAYSSIRSQLNENADRLDVLTAGEKLLADLETEVETLEGWEKVRVTFRAMPKSRQFADEAYLSLWQDGEEKYFLECIWNGTAFQTEADVVCGEYTGYFVQCRGNAFQIQNVSKELEQLSSMVTADCSLGVHDTQWNAESGKLTMVRPVLRVEPPRIATRSGVVNWTKLDLVVKRNAEVVRRLNVLETFETDLQDAEIFVEYPRTLSEYYRWNTDLHLMRQEPLVLEIPGMQAGDRITLVIEGQLNNGYSFEEDVYSIAF